MNWSKTDSITIVDEQEKQKSSQEQNAFALESKPESGSDSGFESDGGIFHGDSGLFPFDTRRVLVQLLSGPLVDGKRHAKLWPVLMRDEKIVRRYLSEIFLELVIDHELQVAFTRQADTEDLEAPSILRRAQLSFIDSILLLYLRQRLTQAGSQGDRAVVSTEEIVESLTLFERDSNTDRAGFIKRVLASIEKIKKYNILQKIRSTEDRFEISAALKLLFSAEEILSLTKRYQSLSESEPATDSSNIELEQEEMVDETISIG